MQVFVGSSKENLETARQVTTQLNTAGSLEAHIWSEDVFADSETYIASLENALDWADFAVLILSGDDPGQVREKQVILPRDNVIFELGLFVGRFGRDRCRFFVAGGSDTKLASDLSGVKAVEYRSGTGGSSLDFPPLKKQVNRVTQDFTAMGCRYKPGREVRVLQAEHWHFSQRLAGHWWERMCPGDDKQSALSYIKITVNEVTNTPFLKADAYHTDAHPLAGWESVVTGIQPGHSPALYYRWEGEHRDARGQKYGGGGEILFDNNSLTSATCYFYDTNYALIGQGEMTRIKNGVLCRATPEEVAGMESKDPEATKALVQRKLDELKERAEFVSPIGKE